MATDEEKQPETSPLALKTTASLRDHVSQSNSSDSPPKRGEPTPKLQSEMEFIMSVASKLASQPLHNKDPQVWGVLTAISTNARKRRQGSNMLLSADEHKIGRLVMDAHFRIDSLAVSANHCKIYRKVIGNEASDHHSKCQTCVLLKDTSTNGTFINWKKLTKSDPEVNINHGDIISFAAAPHQDAAYSFVYREVAKATAQLAGGAAKRKGEELGSDIKRVKGIGIGSLEGPLSLDDFRSLQRSNAELRKQLEDQVSRIDALQNENRVAVERHEKDVKELKESISSSYIDQLKKLQDKLDIKQKELLDLQKSSAEQKHAIEDLNERLSASMQSCAEANEIMNSRKATIAELKEQLLEERDQRREERGKAGADLKAALQRAHAEAQEELKRLSDAATRRETEQQELINKLQETERERCSLLDSLRSKLEDTRQNLVISDNKVRQLEAQICEEQQASSKERERVEELEKELRTLRKELESEKAAREEAWAKVSTLELEISAAIHDLDFERRRLRGARERVLLRETQLRAFYSTTEEIMLLFSKQQEQLKAMQRTLEDEENYENTSLDFDLTVTPRKIERVLDRSEDKNRCGNKEAREGSSTSAPRCDRDLVSASTDEASVTEKHDCNIKSQEDAQYTQEADVTSANHNGKGGFGSEIDGVETEPVVEGDPIGTECVLETESLGIEGERNIDLNNAGVVAGETMQLDDGTNVQESADLARTRQEQETQNEFQLNNVSQNLKATQDTEMEMGATIRTTDLLASEVAGSWACSTAPSVHGENESQRSRGENEVGDAPLHDSNVLVAESQSTPSSNAAGARLNHEHRALTEMIGIVAPDLRKKFVSSVGDNLSEERENEDSVSNSDTEDYTESDHANESCKGGSDVEMDGSNQRAEGQHSDDTMGEDDDDTEEDSLG